MTPKEIQNLVAIARTGCNVTLTAEQMLYLYNSLTHAEIRAKELEDEIIDLMAGEDI